MLHLVPRRIPAGEKPYCEWCKDVPLRRLSRLGWIEKAVLPLFGFFPWECELCQRVSHLRLRGVLKRGAVNQPSSKPERLPALPGTL